MSINPVTNQTNNVVRVEANEGRYTRSVSSIAKRVSYFALGLLAIHAVSNVPTAEAGIFSGIVTAVGCFGASAVFPTNLFWAAAPCYELTMLATANPLLP